MNTPSTKSRIINISLPAALVTKMDEVAKTEFASRSDFIRDSILRKLDAQSPWEVVTDFTTVQKGGVDLEDLLARL